MSLCQEVRATVFFSTVSRFIESNQLLEGVRHIRVAFSGGADSTALLVCLWAIGEGRGIDVTAHHIRHGLRASDGIDAEIARSTAEQLGISFEQTDLEMGQVASNVEDAARSMRWAALEAGVPASLRAETVIATAHNGDENLETLLWRLQRGCGVEGATLAVRSKAEVMRIRPLLCVGKDEIYAFLRQIGVRWAEDPTNATDHYLRNRIRHHILPVILEQLGQRGALYRSLVNLGRDAAATGALAEVFAKQFMHGGAWVCPEDVFKGLGAEAQTQLLRHAARQLEPGHVPDAKFVDEARLVVTSKNVSRKKSTNETVTFSWSRSAVMGCATKSDEVTAKPIELETPVVDIDVWGVCRLTAYKMRCVDIIKNTREVFFFSWKESLGKLRIVMASEVEWMRTSDGRVTKTFELLKKMGLPEVWRRQWPVLVSESGPLWILAGPRSDVAITPTFDEDTICIILQNIVSF